MNVGWIKLHRELLEKPIWTGATSEQKVLLVTLLLMANHSEKEWEWQGKKFTARPGQFITSLPSLVQKCGKDSSIQKVRTALKRFVKYEFLTDESTAHNRLITIVNWDVYQEGATAPLTDEQQTPNRQVTANKNVKNEENEKKRNHRKQVYDGTSPFYQLALAFFEQLTVNHPGVKEPNLQQWANDFRLLVERDGRTIEQINHLTTWSAQHAFWHTVVLSPASIRRHWDRLVAQVKREHASAKAPVQQTKVEEFSLDLAKGENG